MGSDSEWLDCTEALGDAGTQERDFSTATFEAGTGPEPTPPSKGGPHAPPSALRPEVSEPSTFEPHLRSGCMNVTSKICLFQRS